MAFDRRAYMRTWMQKRRRRWRAAGCCPDCGLPTRRFTYCAVHRDKSNRTVKETCLDCEKAKAPGRVRCVDCLKKHRLAMADRRAKAARQQVAA